MPSRLGWRAVTGAQDPRLNRQANKEQYVIRLTRISGEQVVVNADLIEFVEMTPDTLVTLFTGKKIPVRESADEVIGRVVAYRRSLGAASTADLYRHTSGATQKGE